MSLRNQPYIKLFPKDWLSDDKLKECSAEAHGLLINMMCIMHQSEDYGTILLKQKYKQNPSKTPSKTQTNSNFCLNFASQLAKQLSFSVEEIESGLTELIHEGVVLIDADKLSQKRMVKDGKLSDTRASAGSKGGKNKVKGDKKAREFANNFAKAKSVANYEYEYVSEHEYENEIDKKNKKVSKKSKTDFERTVDDFLEMRKKIKKPATERAMKTIFKKLEEMAPGDELKKILILEQSIERCWQTVYPLKDGNSSYNGQAAGEKAVSGKGNRYTQMLDQLKDNETQVDDA